MKNGVAILRWIKSRRSTSLVAGCLAQMVLWTWKLARRVPWLNRLKIGVRVDEHRMRVRLFSYDDLLMISDRYESTIDGILPPRGGVAVDAGAFIGRHVLTYASAVGPQGRVVAIEALPINFKLLDDNVRLNELAQVACVPCALGRDERDVWLCYDRETSTASTLCELPQRVQVAQKPLDRVLEDIGIAQIDLLKVDVEGAELDVLEGGSKTLDASPNAKLVIEIHDCRPRERGACPVYDWLAGRGYSISRHLENRRMFYLAEKSLVPAHV